MSPDCAGASEATRSCTAATSTSTASTGTEIPSWPASRTAVRPPAEAMKVLDGTQSASTHAPPGPSGSTRVTSAPYCAATSAASYPAGPPPMITILVIAAPWRSPLRSRRVSAMLGRQCDVHRASGRVRPRRTRPRLT